MNKIKIFAVNPGSTSTKIALFNGTEKIFSENVSHDANELDKYQTIAGQLEYRMNTIEKILEKHNVNLEDVDAYVGRGGGLIAMEGGTYEIDNLILDHAKSGANGVQHPAMLGPQIADSFAVKYGKKAYVVNPPDVDELQDLARMTGIKGVYRSVHLHALNLKETAIRHAEKNGKEYSECNYIVCHIGGGISISAHKNGKMIDGFDIVGGEGPMAPTRCGSISVSDVLKCCENMSIKEVKQLCTKNGGFVSHLGMSDAKELEEKANAGDKYASMLWNSMIYQIEKCIGSMAVVLEGKVDAILLGGGMVYSKSLVSKISDSCGWIADVISYPGEFEMEAMVSGVLRVLDGKETVKKYTGKNIFKGFEF